MGSEVTTALIQGQFYIQYPTFTLDVEFSVPAAGVTAIFGHSGSGKTTLLRCIAGLEKVPGGQLDFCGDPWQSGRRFVATHRRDIGYVFQEPSLFAHLTVRQNLDYGRRRVDNPMNDNEAAHIIELLGLRPLLERQPDKLSGGEKQRVAIARALLLKPKLLLMDEPLASLDHARKQEILGYLERLKSELTMPILYVSHSMDEVARLADHLVVIERGQIQAQGPLQQVLSERQLLQRQWQQYGDEMFSLLIGKVVTPCTTHQLTEVDVDGVLIRMPRHEVTAGQEVRLRLAARDISLALACPQQTSILNVFECTILAIDEVADAGQCQITMSLGQHRLMAFVSLYSSQALNLAPGVAVFAQIKAVSIHE